MALLRYMRPVDGLPDPRGQLSLTLPSSSIVEANRLVQEVTKEAAKQKRGPYKTSALTQTSRRFSNGSFPYVVVNVVSTHA